MITKIMTSHTTVTYVYGRYSNVWTSRTFFRFNGQVGHVHYYLVNTRIIGYNRPLAFEHGTRSHDACMQAVCLIAARARTEVCGIQTENTLPYV